MAPGSMRRCPRRQGVSAEVLRHQLFQAYLGTGPQLRHDLTGAEGPELPAALKGFPLRVGMQEATGVEVSGSSGIHQGAEAENADVEALVAA